MNSNKLYKSHFCERQFIFYIWAIPTFIFVIICYVQIRDNGDKFQFFFSKLKEALYIMYNNGILYSWMGITLIIMFFIYSYVVTNSYIEKKYLISIWKNKRINIEDIVFVEFQAVNGHGGDFTHFFIHTEKDIIELEATSSYKKLYDALKKLDLEINVRQEMINRYPYLVKRAFSKGMDIKVNPLLEEKYLKMKK